MSELPSRSPSAAYKSKLMSIYSPSLSAWILLSVSLLMTYIPTQIYITEVYFETVDMKGKPEETMRGTSIPELVVNYSVRLRSKMFDYMTLGARIGIAIGSCLFSFAFIGEKRRLAQVIVTLIGIFSISSPLPGIYVFGRWNQIQNPSSFYTFTVFSAIGIVCFAIGLLWGQFFDFLDSRWERETLHVSMIAGAFLFAMFYVIGGINCHFGGTFLPSVIIYGISFWMILLPVVYGYWQYRKRQRAASDGLAASALYYTPETTPLVAPSVI